MAEGTIEELKQALVQAMSEGMQAVLPGIIKGIFGSTRESLIDTVKDATSKGIEDGADKGSKAAKDALAWFKSFTFNPDLEWDKNKIQQSINELGIAQLFKDSGIHNLALSLGIDDESVKSTLNTLENVASPFIDNWRPISVFAAAHVADQEFKSLSSKLVALEKLVTNVNKNAIGATGSFINYEAIKSTDDLSNSYNSVNEALESYRSGLTRAALATHMSQKDIESVAQTFSGAGINIQAMFNDIGEGGATALRGLSLSSSDAARQFNGLEAAIVLSRGTNLSFNATAKALAFQTKALGLDLREAQNRFGLVKEVQSGTRATTEEVDAAIQSVTERLKYFGNTTQGVSQLYKGLLTSLGSGREAIAAEMFQEITSSLQGANAGMKAFLGQAGQLGTMGGGGAIAGMLQYEEAIAKGDFGGILETIRGQVESITGGPMITREEAISTGREDQFFLERELVKQFTGIADDQKATVLIESLTKGLEDNAAKILQAESGLAKVQQVGAEVLVRETGPTEALANAMEITSQLGLTSKISEALGDSTSNFRLGTVNLINTVEKLREFAVRGGGVVEPAAIDLTKGAANIEEISADVTKSKIAEKTFVSAISEDVESAKIGEISAAVNAKDVEEVGKLTAAAVNKPTVPEIGTLTAEAAKISNVNESAIEVASIKKAEGEIAQMQLEILTAAIESLKNEIKGFALKPMVSEPKITVQLGERELESYIRQVNNTAISR